MSRCSTSLRTYGHCSMACTWTCLPACNRGSAELDFDQSRCGSHAQLFRALEGLHRQRIRTPKKPLGSSIYVEHAVNRQGAVIGRIGGISDKHADLRSAAELRLLKWG